jgi:hypothetical protein
LELCSTGPRPIATNTETKNIPVALPKTVATAARLPQAIALAIVKRTDGPGASMIKIAAIRYSQRRDGIRSEENI